MQLISFFLVWLSSILLYSTQDHKVEFGWRQGLTLQDASLPKDTDTQLHMAPGSLLLVNAWKLIDFDHIFLSGVEISLPRENMQAPPTKAPKPDPKSIMKELRWPWHSGFFFMFFSENAFAKLNFTAADNLSCRDLLFQSKAICLISFKRWVCCVQIPNNKSQKHWLMS